MSLPLWWGSREHPTGEEGTVLGPLLYHQGCTHPPISQPRCPARRWGRPSPAPHLTGQTSLCTSTHPCRDTCPANRTWPLQARGSRDGLSPARATPSPRMPHCLSPEHKGGTQGSWAWEAALDLSVGPSLAVSSAAPGCPQPSGPGSQAPVAGKCLLWEVPVTRGCCAHVCSGACGLWARESQRPSAGQGAP